MNTTPELKDYFCPFCHCKLFRGNVKEFKQVCLECNRLVDSSKMPHDEDNKSGKPNQDFPELAE